METEQLREFVLVAETGSLRSAAARLGLSPAALSAHMAALEESLGVRLLERNSHGARLTEQGRLFERDAAQLTGDWDKLRSRLASLDDSAGRRLRVAVAGQSMPPRLGPFLDIFNLRYPDVRLSLLDDRETGIADGLGDGADLYFAYAAEAPAGTERRSVYSTALCVLVPQSHRLAYRTRVSLRELEGERFILTPETRENSLRERERALLAGSGIAFSLYDEPVSPTWYQLLVPIGKGLAFCPWVARDLVPPGSAVLALSDEGCAIPLYMLFRPDNPNPLLGRFREEFGEYLREAEELS